jgi:MFS family permease
MKKSRKNCVMGFSHATKDAKNKTDIRLSDDKSRYSICIYLYIYTGIKEDTNTTEGASFNVAIALFFVGYIIANFPSNLILQRLSPRIWVSFIGLMWGLSVVLIGFAKGQLVLFLGRFLLGVFESGILPACLLITATWYPKSEHATKIAIWFAFSSIGSALGGIVSYLIQSHISGGGYKGWAYLMFIEGGITVLWSLLSFFVTPDVPEKATFLTEQERLIVIARLKADKTQSSLAFNKEQMMEAFFDYKTWLYAIIYFCWMGINSGISFFGPTIINGLGFSYLDSQLLAAPFAVANYIIQMGISKLSDKHNNRSYYLLGSGVISIVGFACVILIPNSSSTLWALYSSLFLTCLIPGSLTLILGWATSNIVGHTKRTVSVTVISLAAAIGGFAGSFVYMKSDEPRYVKGHLVNALIVVVGMGAILALTYLLKKENARRDEITEAEKTEEGEDGSAKPNIAKAEDLKDAFNENFTDKDPSYRYSF